VLNAHDNGIDAHGERRGNNKGRPSPDPIGVVGGSVESVGEPVVAHKNAGDNLEANKDVHCGDVLWVHNVGDSVDDAEGYEPQ